MKPSNHARPLIGITMGDPSGIGPEIIVKLISDPETHTLSRPVVIGDRTVLQKAIDLTELPVSITQISSPADYRQGTLNLIETSSLSPSDTTLASPTQETGKAMEGYISKGVDLAMNGAIDAMVTAPITKTGLKMAGSPFPGHTELIAHRTRTTNFAMMMAGDTLKVVLVTIHIALADIPGHLTSEEITRIICLTHESLRSRFGIENPKIAIAALNPHAGEEGMFGNEESDVIRPAMAEAEKTHGIRTQGPLPPDTVFYHAVRGQYDAVVCMYHDQGLIPFKLTHFEDGVNTTLGLPIIRTSVDHGTAYDIAWKGTANPASLKAALKMAVLQAENRRDTLHGN